MSDIPDEIPKRYSLRLLTRARRDVDAAIVHFEETIGSDIAQLWLGRLYEEIASLAVNPTRFPVIPEQSRFGSVAPVFRHLVWRRVSSSVAYRIVFWVGEEGDDGPTVFVAYVRHAAAKPISRKEARDIQEAE